MKLSYASLICTAVRTLFKCAVHAEIRHQRTCRTLRPLPNGGACVNMATGLPAAAASVASRNAICSSSMCTSCTLDSAHAVMAQLRRISFALTLL